LEERKLLHIFQSKIKVMLYKVSNEQLVIKEIKKLQPLNYNQFRWWRRFDTKNKPLPAKSTFLERIKNQEYEFSQYYWQWKFCELEINQFYTEYKGDVQKLINNNGVDLARRKRLIGDFEKDEFQKLEDIKKGFIKEFVMSKEEYYLHIEDFDGTIEDFYQYCLKTFDKRKQERRGRPKKY
jgi:hypothetical protein